MEVKWKYVGIALLVFAVAFGAYRLGESQQPYKERPQQQAVAKEQPVERFEIGSVQTSPDKQNQVVILKDTKTGAEFVVVRLGTFTAMSQITK